MPSTQTPDPSIWNYTKHNCTCGYLQHLYVMDSLSNLYIYMSINLDKMLGISGSLNQVGNCDVAMMGVKTVPKSAEPCPELLYPPHSSQVSIYHIKGSRKLIIWYDRSFYYGPAYLDIIFASVLASPHGRVLRVNFMFNCSQSISNSSP